VERHSGKGSGQAGGKAPGKLPLREHRVRAGVQLAAISEATKLSRRFLEAIEEGSYGELPGGVFTTSYIRQYAAATGYDAEVILEHYRQWCGGLSEGESRSGSKAPGVRWGKLVLFG
jgi:cytoskeletal protein RodZ